MPFYLTFLFSLSPSISLSLCFYISVCHSLCAYLTVSLYDSLSLVISLFCFLISLHLYILLFLTCVDSFSAISMPINILDVSKKSDLSPSTCLPICLSVCIVHISDYLAIFSHTWVSSSCPVRLFADSLAPISSTSFQPLGSCYIRYLSHCPVKSIQSIPSGQSVSQSASQSVCMSACLSVCLLLSISCCCYEGLCIAVRLSDYILNSLAISCRFNEQVFTFIKLRKKAKSHVPWVIN